MGDKHLFDKLHMSEADEIWGGLTDEEKARVVKKAPTKEQNEMAQAINEFVKTHPAMQWVCRSEIEKVLEAIGKMASCQSRVPGDIPYIAKEILPLIEGWLK